MRRLLLACVFLLPGAPASAEPQDPLPHYLRSGHGFACVSNRADVDRAEAEHRDVCLQIGPLFVGVSRGNAEALLGKPVASAPVGDRRAYAYRLQEDSSGRMTTYVVLTYDGDGKADSVQLTGLAWNGNWRFCGLTLGSSAAALTSRLGEPFSSGKSDDPGAEQWNYLPWTFSFEVKAGLISSIRLAR